MSSPPNLGDDAKNPDTNTATPPSASSLSSPSAGISASPSHPSSFSFAPPFAAELAASGYFTQSLGLAQHGRGSSPNSSHQGHVAAGSNGNPTLEESFFHDAGWSAGGPAGGDCSSRQGDGVGHHHHLHHGQKQCDLDNPPLGSGISRDCETFRAGQRQQQRQHGGPDGAPQLRERDLLPFDGWFEGGVGASSEFGDIETEGVDKEVEKDGGGTGSRLKYLHLYGMP